MGQKLVIVESPAKAKTIKKYLGKNYVVEASMGHVRDLPKSQLGVDVENNYEPKYITIRGKGELLDKLKREAKKCEKVYLATDPDREGEAISWHLANVLKIDEKDKCRIEFNEITKNAIKNAIKNPRQLNEHVFDAQQARRVLDRLVGYEISPILWRKVRWGLSAGRVQSVALRIICDREKEISDFTAKEYWSIEAKLSNKGETSTFITKLFSKNGKKLEVNTKAESDLIIRELIESEFSVKSIKTTEKTKNPLPPFTTSTMQQDAYRKINFSTKKTMSTAQQLYEGVEVKGFGTVGLITYMRTDSVRVADEAQNMAAEFIKSTYGSEYLPTSKRVYKGKKSAQDAHEAIRPTHFDITPEMAKGSLSNDQFKLYSLIWNRFISSQMASTVIDSTTVEIKNGEYILKTSGYKVKFDGFTKLYISESEEEETAVKLPKLEENEVLIQKSIDGKQHFTQPPPKFSEASLVKTLEENGIGRPSTYSPTISTLLDRKYIERNKKVLEPTELGFIVNNIVSEYFKEIVDIEFTAEMEDNLDRVEEGKVQWKEIVDNFFKPLKKSIEIAEKEIAKITIEDKVSDVKCDKCGRFMVIKQGRFGDFLACPGYPECQNTKPITKEVEAPCPKCGGKILEKRSKKGKTFYGCGNYPACDFVSWHEPTTERCPDCGEVMVKRYSKAKGDYLECINKNCKYKKLING